MAGAADALPFSVANILKVDLSKEARKKSGQSSNNASKALTLAERLAGESLNGLERYYAKLALKTVHST